LVAARKLLRDAMLGPAPKSAPPNLTEARDFAHAGALTPAAQTSALLPVEIGRLALFAHRR